MTRNLIGGGDSTEEPVAEADAGTDAVSCAGLVYAFGETTAVDGLELSVHDGEVFGLLGPNGAGKTTAIRCITTLLPVPTGMVRVFGHDATRERMAVRRLLGYVPQQLSADAGLTGRENVALFARVFDVPRKERAARGTHHPRCRRRREALSRTPSSVNRHALTSSPSRARSTGTRLRVTNPRAPDTTLTVPTRKRSRRGGASGNSGSRRALSLGSWGFAPHGRVAGVGRPLPLARSGAASAARATAFADGGVASVRAGGPPVPTATQEPAPAPGRGTRGSGRWPRSAGCRPGRPE